MAKMKVLTIFSLLGALNIVAAQDQTETQKEVWQNVAAVAETASSNAASTVMSLFESEKTLYWLTELDDGSSLYSIPPNELHDMFFNELSVAELVHNFGHVNDGSGNCGMDVTVQPLLGPEAPIFYNQWELQALGYIPVDAGNNIFTEHTETSFFHFPAFRNVSDPDMATSEDRPVYAALNMFRSSGGNPQCGPIAMVFNRDYIQDQILVAPLDTGAFYGKCGVNSTYPATAPNMFEQCNCLNCSSWEAPTEGSDEYNNSRALGIPGKVNHLLLPYLSFFNATTAEAGTEDYIYLNLARLIIRLLSRKTYAVSSTSSQSSSILRLNFMENTLGYLEFNPVLSLNYPDAIGMVVAMFEVLFGTDQGVQLQEWCIAQGWVLAWAHNPLDSLWFAGPSADNMPPVPSWSEGLQQANRRILDPKVLKEVAAGLNMTQNNNDFDTAYGYFQQQWDLVNGTIASMTNLSSIPRRLLYDKQWHALVYSTYGGEQASLEKEKEGASNYPVGVEMNTSDGINNDQGEGLAFSVLSVEPIYFNACESSKCVAVRTLDAACVCNA